MGVAGCRPAGDEGQTLVIGGQDPASIIQPHGECFETFRHQHGEHHMIFENLIAGIDFDQIAFMDIDEVLEDFTVDIVMTIQDGVTRQTQQSGGIVPADGGLVGCEPLVIGLTLIIDLLDLGGDDGSIQRRWR